MRPFAPIIFTLVLFAGASSFQTGCSSQPEMVLESDIPNVAGFDPIITRDIERSGDQVTSVEVIYRGDLKNSKDNIESTKERFNAAGWELVSQQARGKTTILNFTKDSRKARVDIALNQIEPMMSPALLRVRSISDVDAPKAPSVPTTAATTSQTIMPEGFAPPPNK